MIRILTVCLGVALGATQALAQQAAPQRPAAPAPAPAAPAPAAPAAPAPSAAHVAIAKEVVQLSGLSRSFDFVVPQFSEQLRQSFSVTRPEIMKDLTQALQDLRPEFESQREDILNAAARIFAGRMSEADLKEVAAFFKSPAGQRYVAAQPGFMDDFFGEMQAWSRRLSEFMMVRVRAELKKKNIEF